MGNGTHKPTGLLNATGGAQVGVTAASATAITADEVIDLFYSLGAPYRKNAIWILNDATVKAIRKLKDSSGQYLWQPALKDGEFDTILGKRYFTSAYMPTMTAGAKTILFGDLSYYWIGDRQGITFQRLNERFADYGQLHQFLGRRGHILEALTEGNHGETHALQVLNHLDSPPTVKRDLTDIEAFAQAFNKLFYVTVVNDITLSGLKETLALPDVVRYMIPTDTKIKVILWNPEVWYP